MPGGYLYGFKADGTAIKVQCDANGYLKIDPTEILENQPTEDLATKAPTSEWAFDHDADPAAHHAKYTDVESRAAINNLIGSDGKMSANLDMDKHQLLNCTQYTFYDYGGSEDYVRWNYYVNLNRILIRNYLAAGGSGALTLQVFDGVGYRTLQNNLQVAALIATHASLSAAHHAKYTDAEAVAAWYNRVVTITTGTISNESLSDKSMIILDKTGGDITLKGFADGVDGQIVHCVCYGSTYAVNVINNSGDAAAGDKIYTYINGDDSITGGNIGGFTMIYYSNMWRILQPLT